MSNRAAHSFPLFVLALMFYQRGGARHCPGISMLAFLMVLVYVSIPFRFLFGLYESSHWLVMLANILSKAEAKADQQRTEENAVATAERKAEVMKGASDVQQTVSHMPDDDVDRELHEHFTRPGSR
ncbi:phage holin family protein [Klebsiella pneumoniae]|nr:phage holin family protein [Klebsiella pneumoniae]WJU41577.1 phage holin family protein [Klebsiella pneumoniae]WLX55258.1 phage holin family protein [Klebsiella pneumoniae]